MTMLIDPDDAGHLYELADGETHNGWTRITEQESRTGRWLQYNWLVVTRGEGCYGIPFAIGLTEMQDDQYPWDDDPDKQIEMTPLVGVQISATTYLTEAQYKRHLVKDAAR